MKHFRVVDAFGCDIDPEDLAEEEFVNELMLHDLDGFAIRPNGRLVLLDEFGNYAEVPDGLYEITWQTTVE